MYHQEQISVREMQRVLDAVIAPTPSTLPPAATSTLSHHPVAVVAAACTSTPATAISAAATLDVPTAAAAHPACPAAIPARPTAAAANIPRPAAIPARPTAAAANISRPAVAAAIPVSLPTNAAATAPRPTSATANSQADPLVINAINGAHSAAEIVAIAGTSFKVENLLNKDGNSTSHIVCSVCFTDQVGRKKFGKWELKPMGQVGKVSRAWAGLRDNLRKHVSHMEHRSAMATLQSLGAARISASLQYGVKLVGMVYERVLMNASYRSYETGVQARYISGVAIGDQNHSRNFPPIAIKAMYDILVARLQRALQDNGSFGFIKPFFSSQDKDRSNLR